MLEGCAVCVVGVCCACGAHAKWSPAVGACMAVAVEVGVARCAEGVPARRAWGAGEGEGESTMAHPPVLSVGPAHAAFAWCMVCGGWRPVCVRRTRAGRGARYRAQRVRERRRRCERGQGRRRTARLTRVPAPGAYACLAACVGGGGRAKEASRGRWSAFRPTKRGKMS